MGRSADPERFLDERVRALVRTLPGAREGDVRALHRARVASRRLREALPIALRQGSARKLERKVRGVTRALGPVRELDVTLQILDELDRKGSVPERALPKLRRVLVTERQRLARDMNRQLAGCDLHKLRKAALAAVRREEDARPERLERARQRAARRAERLLAAMERAAGLYLPDRLHDIRIAVKRLRYALELLHELTGSGATARIRTLKAAQDLLGRMHDLEVLMARARALQGQSPPGRRGVVSDLDAFARTLEADCRRLHGQYMAQRRRLETICQAVLAAAQRTRAAA